jgi:hypothetical protein
MGMEFKLEQITPFQLKQFLASPQMAYEWVMDDIMGPVTDMLGQDKMKTTMEEMIARTEEAFKKLPAAMQKEAARSVEVMRKQYEAMLNPKESAEVRKRCVLDKDWHVLHYAINKTNDAGQEPLSWAVLGGHEIPDEEGVMGYGPVKYLAPKEVKEVAKALESVDASALCSNLDKDDAKKKEIYLAHTLGDREEWEYLPELFERLREFYREAAADGNAVLLEMS